MVDTAKYIVKKKYTAGKHAQLVFLLEDITTGNLLIKKRYNKRERDIFRNEVKNLTLLNSAPFTPKLLKVKEDTLTLYMTYCGDPISDEKFKLYYETIEKYKKMLRRKWGIHHNDLRIENICLRNGRIYFIDFGWASTKKIQPSRENQHQIG